MTSELEVLPHFVHFIESMISPIAGDLVVFYSRVAVGNVLIGEGKHGERTCPVGGVRGFFAAYLLNSFKWRNAKGRETRPFETIRLLMLVVSIVLVAAG